MFVNELHECQYCSMMFLGEEDSNNQECVEKTSSYTAHTFKEKDDMMQCMYCTLDKEEN